MSGRERPARAREKESATARYVRVRLCQCVRSYPESGSEKPQIIVCGCWKIGHGLHASDGWEYDGWLENFGSIYFKHLITCVVVFG